MLRKFFVFALAAVSLVAATYVPITSGRVADMDLLGKQKKMLDLLMYVGSDLRDTEWYEIGRRYDISANVERYDNREIVMEFIDYCKMGMLKKDAICTYYHPEQRYEMMLLYRLMYSAKDFTTFYKTACWARLHANAGIFAIALTTAIIYRDDTKYLRLPAVYEIYPYVFFNSKNIRDAQRVIMSSRSSSDLGRHSMRPEQTLSDSVDTYHLHSNVTNMCWTNVGLNDECKMAYFTEDVGLNSYYFNARMMMPFWLNTKEYDANMPKNMRGDLYFYVHQQLMARYYLERISNGLGGIEEYTWDRMNMPGFNSEIVYGNGIAMPKRDWWNVVPSYKLKYVEMIKRLESRIVEAIDSGYVIDETGKSISIMTPEGLNILGNIVEGNYDSVNLKYYGSYDGLARDIFGSNMETTNKNYYVPNALQLWGSSMKDPAFYRIYDRIAQFYLRYKSLLKRYPKNQLEFSGVKIENVEVDKLVTYWDRKEYLINNVIDVTTINEGMTFNIKNWQYNLNYKPFTYKMSINSDKTTKAVIRIFLGPAIDGKKYDDNYSYLIRNYKYFFMLDEFEVNVREGMNNIDRKSTESTLFKGETMPVDKLYRKIVYAMQGKEPMSVKENTYGFPEHLLLPKGSISGMRYKLLIYIGQEETGKLVDLPILGKRMWYGKSLGYPLDRPMYPWFLQLDNVYLKDIYIQNIVNSEITMGERSSNTMANYEDVMQMRTRDESMRPRDMDTMTNSGSMNRMDMMRAHRTMHI